MAFKAPFSASSIKEIRSLIAFKAPVSSLSIASIRSIIASCSSLALAKV
jgi:hypothetical protein